MEMSSHRHRRSRRFSLRHQRLLRCRLCFRGKSNPWEGTLLRFLHETPDALSPKHRRHSRSRFHHQRSHPSYRIYSPQKADVHIQFGPPQQEHDEGIKGCHKVHGSSFQ